MSNKKNKKYSDSRLREIALMISHGLPAKLIAEITGLPQKTVWNICGIYKWPQETLDEMTKRGELSERVEEIDRSVGATHNLYCSLASRICNIEKILKQDVIDGNAHSRIDLLARCSGDHNKQIEELTAQVAKLEERSHIMAKCSDDQVLEIHKRFDAMTPQIEGLVTQLTHLTKKYDELSTEQLRPVLKVDHRLNAMTKQIERLQDILTEIAEILPREFD